MKVGETITLDIKTTNARINIESPPPKLNVRTIKAEMKVERRSPSFRRVRNRRMGSPVKRSQPRQIKDVKPYVKEAIKSIAADKGSKNLHKLENNISKLAPGMDILQGINARLEGMMEEEESIVWDPGYVKTTWTQPKTIIEWDIRRPKITVEPYSIDIKVKRRPRMKIAAKAIQRHTIDKKA